MKYPNTSMTSFELIETLVSDLGLYDRAYWLIGEDASRPSGWAVRPIPPAWVIEHKGGNAFEPAVYVFQPPGSAKRLEVSAKNILDFHGWNPGRPKHGTSPVETLKQVLAEQVQAWSYREQVWSRGGRVGAYLTRPKDSNWSDAARERFAKDWKDRWTGRDGKKAGGTPILEDGMELKRLGFSAREDEWVEAARLALETVAGVYHVNPTMVGGNASATFSNVKEFRKMLYSETLGPTLARVEDRINTFLAPIVSARGDAYVEFNLEEKLQGDFGAGRGHVNLDGRPLDDAERGTRATQPPRDRRRRRNNNAAQRHHRRPSLPTGRRPGHRHPGEGPGPTPRAGRYAPGRGGQGPPRARRGEGQAEDPRQGAGDGRRPQPG